MSLDLPVVLWIAVPMLLFLVFVFSVLVVGWSASGQVFRGERPGGARAAGRSGLLANVVVQNAAVPVMAPAPAESVESASPVATGARRPQAR